MTEINKNEFTVDDYEYLTELIDEAMKNMDRIKVNRLSLLKNKIYRVLEADGLKDQIDEVIKKKWDIVEIDTKNGIRRMLFKKKD